MQTIWIQRPWSCSAAVFSVYGVEHNIKYNSSKSAVLICRTIEDTLLKCPDFKLSDNYLCVKVKYLGHYRTDDR